MNSSLLSLIFIVMLSSCGKSEKPCRAGYNLLDEQIKENIHVLKPVANENLLFSGEAYRSVFFLMEITNIEGQVQFGDVSSYEKSKFDEDCEAWLKWLEFNKCSIPDSIVLSLQKAIEDKTPWVEISDRIPQTQR